jgi:hypothetical protein
MNILKILPFSNNRLLLLWILGSLILAAMLLAPLWIVEFPPLLDYPNHLARAFVLVHLQDTAFDFSRFFRSDWGLYPYLGMDALLAVLGRIFPIETAGRLLLSLCAIALPAGAWFFLRAVDPRENARALWGLPIACNVFFLEGFLNFDLSLALGFIALGLWLRWLTQRNAILWIAALLTFTALYLTHLLGFGIAGFVMIAYLLFDRRPVRDWVWSGVLGLPGVGFYLCTSRIGLSNVHTIILHNWSEKWKSLRTFFQGYSLPLDIVFFVAIGIWLVAAWWRNPEFRWNGRWIALSAVLFLLFLAIPWMWGEGSDLDVRVLPILFISIFTGVHAGRRAKWLAIIPILVFALKTMDLAKYFVGVQPELAGLARSFDAIPRNALVFTIVEGDQNPIERPFTHFWAYGVIRRGWFSPYLFDVAGETPMRIVHNSYTADGFWNLIYAEAPDWEQIRRNYDYVWDYDTPRFSKDLNGIGDRIYSYGPLEVYRIRKM